MGTKNNPGEFDCYANAEPDEPMFVLLGRDPMAGMLVRIWAVLRRASGESAAKVQEAERCADLMDQWARMIGKFPYKLEELQVRMGVQTLAALDYIVLETTSGVLCLRRLLGSGAEHSRSKP
ncbi:MAG: hypothetical protein WBY94_06635 [Polyangiaceae bacterium]